MSHASKVKKDWLTHYTEMMGKWRGIGRGDREDAMHDTVVGMLEGGAVTAIYDPRAYMARGTLNRLFSGYRHMTCRSNAAGRTYGAAWKGARIRKSPTWLARASP